MDEEIAQLGEYYIEKIGDNLKVTLIDPKSSISVLPSSGNCIVIKPVPSGSNQLKTE